MKGYILWNASGVMFNSEIDKGKITTYLSRFNQKKPEELMQEFENKAGITGYPLESVTPEELRKGWQDWVNNYNKGKPIENYHELGLCLTDLRHHVKSSVKEGNVFPSKKETIYTKNMLLKGLSLKDVKKALENVELTPGLEQATKEFKENDFKQLVFSSSTGYAIDVIVDRLGLDYGEGVTAYVSDIRSEKTEPFDKSKHLGNPNFILTGSMKNYDKESSLESYPDIEWDKAFIIGDSILDVKQILDARERGAEGFGFNPGKYKENFEKAGIEILSDLREFPERVLERTD